MRFNSACLVCEHRDIAEILSLMGNSTPCTLAVRRREDHMAIKVIVELHAKPGRRDELKSVLESLVATQGPGQDGFLGSMRYGLLDEPDVLVEIADWESAEARDAHMKEAAITGVYEPLLQLLAAPFRVMVISQLSDPD